MSEATPRTRGKRKPVAPPKNLKEFLPFLEVGMCPHKNSEEDFCLDCLQHIGALIEKILKLWKQRRLLEQVDPLDPE